LIQKDKFNSIVNLIFPGLLIGTGVIYIISCQVGEVAVSGAALACLIGLFIAALSGKYTLFHALGLTLFGWIGFSIVYRLIVKQPMFGAVPVYRFPVVVTRSC